MCLDPVKLRKALKNGARWVLHHYLLSGSSSVGRAIAFQAIGRRFEPGLPLKFDSGSSHIVPRIENRKIKEEVAATPDLSKFGPLVELVTTPPCHGGGQGFESPTDRKHWKIGRVVDRGSLENCWPSRVRRFESYIFRNK